MAESPGSAERDAGGSQTIAGGKGCRGKRPGRQNARRLQVGLIDGRTYCVKRRVMPEERRGVAIALAAVYCPIISTTKNLGQAYPTAMATPPYIRYDPTLEGNVGATIIGPHLRSAGNISAVGTVTNVGAFNITSTSANALTVGRQGTTDPVLRVDADDATVVTGLLIEGNAAGGGLGLSAIGGNAAEALTIDAKGAGAITIGGTSLGAITLGTGVSVPQAGPAAAANVDDEVLVRAAAAATIGKKFLSSGIGTPDTNTGIVGTSNLTLAATSGNWSFVRVGRVVHFKFAITAAPSNDTNSKVLTITLGNLSAAHGTVPPPPVDTTGRGYGTLSSASAAAQEVIGTIATTTTTVVLTLAVTTTATVAVNTTIQGEAWYLTA